MRTFCIPGQPHNFQYEAVSSDEEAISILRQIREQGMHGGVSINPETPINDILNLRSGHCDIVDILAVEPGFGGQLFQESAIQKIEELHQWIDKLAGGGGRGHYMQGKDPNHGRRWN